MQQARERSTEATRAAKGELAAILDQLRKRLEEVGREQASALERSSQDVRDVAGATRSGLAESLDQIGTRLEKAIEARTRGLTGEMMEVAETVRSITTEVRSCIAESMLRVASSNAELAASRGETVEWPRIEVGGDCEASEAETVDVPPELPVETPVEAARSPCRRSWAGSESALLDGADPVGGVALPEPIGPSGHRTPGEDSDSRSEQVAGSRRFESLGAPRRDATQVVTDTGPPRVDHAAPGTAHPDVRRAESASPSRAQRNRSSAGGAVASLPAARRAARGRRFRLRDRALLGRPRAAPRRPRARKGRAQVLVWSTRYAEPTGLPSRPRSGRST
jgi:hypothetical protein